MVEPNYSRLDGPLLLALRETPPGKRLLTVFVHTQEPPSGEQIPKLKELGVAVGDRPKRIHTATLSPNEIHSLSQLAWVKSIKLSHPLKKLPDVESK